MNRKRIIITAAAGLVSFLAAFAVSWLIRPANNPQQGRPTGENQQAAEAAGQQQGNTAEAAQAGSQTTADVATMKMLSEKELKEIGRAHV